MNIPSLISLHYAFTRYAEAAAWDKAGEQYGKVLTKILGPVLNLDNSVPKNLTLF